MTHISICCYLIRALFLYYLFIEKCQFLFTFCYNLDVPNFTYMSCYLDGV